MAGTLRSLPFKVVPSVQVRPIPNMRKHILLLHKSLCEYKFIITGTASRSAFLTEFLCKRNISSIPSIKVVEEKLPASTNQYVSYSPSFIELSNKSEVKQESRNVELYSLKTVPAASKNKSCQEYELPLSMNSLAKEIYFYNGQLHSLSFCSASDQMFSEFEKRMIVLSEASNGPTPEPPNNASGKPSPEQLNHVFEVLSKTLPRLFVHPLDYSIYHPQLIFENNIRGTRTVGLFHYVKQIALLRMIGHFKFAYVSFDILKITAHPEDGTVKVRWRIRGISGMKVFFNFWKFNILKIRETIDRESESWYDGFSIFYIDSEGKVYKHIVDKMQPDPEEKVVKPVKSPLATKLALMLGLAPRDSIDLSQLLSAVQENSRCLYDAMLPLDKIA